MTEKEYVAAADLRAVRIAQGVLHHVLPDVNGLEYYRGVMRTLDAWEDKLAAIVNKALYK